jgi:hypothetical protein
MFLFIPGFQYNSFYQFNLIFSRALHYSSLVDVGEQLQVDEDGPVNSEKSDAKA